MNTLSVYPIVELQPSWLLDVEQMGSKNKRWVKLPNDSQPWLFKFSRESAGTITGEHWAEKLAAEVAALLGVSHARVELARLGGQWGALCRKFDALASDDTELVHGNDLLAGQVCTRCHLFRYPNQCPLRRHRVAVSGYAELHFHLCKKRLNSQFYP